MDEIELTEELPYDFKEEKKKYFQVDLLKSLMIFLVILDHTVAYANLYGKGFELWERIAIPMFLIIMGFNMGRHRTMRQSPDHCRAGRLRCYRTLLCQI